MFVKGDQFQMKIFESVINKTKTKATLIIVNTVVKVLFD